MMKQKIRLSCHSRESGNPGLANEKLKTLPSKPGVYLFKNQVGEVLYIGKAKNLKNPIKSHYNKTVNTKQDPVTTNGFRAKP